MGQGRRRRGGVALAAAGPQPVLRASLRLRRSRPAALGPRGLRLAGIRLQGYPLPGAGQGCHPCRNGGRARPRLPRGSGDRRGPQPRSGRPRSTARHPRGSGDLRSPAPGGAPIWPAEVDGTPAAGVGGPPLPGTRGRPAKKEKGGEMKNGACHLSRNNA